MTDLERFKILFDSVDLVSHVYIDKDDGSMQLVINLPDNGEVCYYFSPDGTFDYIEVL